MRLVVVVGLLVGCGDATPGAEDLAVPADLSVPADQSVADMAVAPDLRPSIDLAYGTNTDGAVACMPGTATNVKKFVVNDQIAPQSRADYAYDLNNDGRNDNQLGNILGAIAQQGLDPQDGLDQSISSGQNLLLIAIRSQDATLANDACAGATVYTAMPKGSPDFSGAGTFAIDNTIAPGNFAGPIASGTFRSEPAPAFAKVPYEVRIQMPLFANVPVNLIGARLQLTYVSPGLVQGRINGAVRKVQIDTEVIPSLAEQLTAVALFSPQIQSLFDNGGAPDPACGNQTCRNMNGTCATSGDLVIDACEVATNAIIRNVLAPDVQLFDAAGNYAPNPLNTTRDSLSVGIAFSAVPATF